MLAAWTTWACGDGGADSPLDVDSSRQLTVRELVQELPPGGLLADDLFLETADGFDLFGDTVAVSDRVAGRVQLFRSSGEHIATLGGPPGPGDPEMLESPMRVQFAPDGTLWVGDPGRAALVGFPSGGGEPQTARLPGAAMATAIGFGVDHFLGDRTQCTAGFRPSALPTARDAFGRPMRRAMSVYVTVSPNSRPEAASSTAR